MNCTPLILRSSLDHVPSPLIARACRAGKGGCPQAVPPACGAPTESVGATPDHQQRAAEKQPEYFLASLTFIFYFFLKKNFCEVTRILVIKYFHCYCSNSLFFCNDGAFQPNSQHSFLITRSFRAPDLSMLNQRSQSLLLSGLLLSPDCT